MIETIWEFVRETIANAVGGVITAVVLALAGALIVAHRKGIKIEDPRKVGCALLIVGITVSIGASFYVAYRFVPAEDVIVLVAEFDGPDPKGQLITSYLGEHLHKELEEYRDRIDLKPLGGSISALEGSQLARREGDRRKAAVLVWGWYGVGDTVDLHFHVEALKRLHDRFLPVLVADVNGQIREPTVGEVNDLMLREQIAVELTDLIAGIAFFADGNWDKAISYFTQASSNLGEGVLMLDDAGVVHFYRGSAHYYSKNFRQAISDFSTSIDLNPNNALAYLGRGFAYYEMDDHYQAVDDLTEAINIAPQLADAYYGRAIAYARIGEYDAAVGDYDKALLALDYNIALLYAWTFQDPALAEAYYQTGHDLAARQNFEEAARRLGRATVLNPEMDKAYFELGLVYVQLDDKEQAEESFKQVLEISHNKRLRDRAEAELEALR